MTLQFLAEPDQYSVIDTYGIELRHPLRHGRSERQLGGKTLSNQRWITGAKVCWLVREDGRVVDWSWDKGNASDQSFRELGWRYAERSLILSDRGFALRGVTHPAWQVCAVGERNERMVVERAFSLVSVVSAVKYMFHRTAVHLQARLAYLTALFNVVWDLAGGKLAMAQFSL